MYVGCERTLLLVSSCNTAADCHHSNDHLVLFVSTVVSINVAALFATERNVDYYCSGRVQYYYVFLMLTCLISRMSFPIEPPLKH